MILGDYLKIKKPNKGSPIVYGSYLGSLDGIITQKELLPAEFLFPINYYYEVSVYDINSGNVIFWNRVPFKIKEERVIFSYYDELKRNVTVEKSYPHVIYPNVSNENKQDIRIDVYQDISGNPAIPNGNYIVSYNFLKSLTTQPLTIYEISPSGNEVKVFGDDTDEFYHAFSRKNFVLKDVYFEIEKILNSFSTIDLYKEVIKNDADVFKVIKLKLGIEKDGEFLVKLNSLYNISEQSIYINNKFFDSKVYGIKFLFNKFLFENFDLDVSFSLIKSEFEKVVTVRLEKEFDRFGKEKNVLIDFFKKIFVEYFFKYKLANIEKEFNNTFNSPFSNVLAFDNNEFYPIVKSYSKEENGHLINVLTLYEPIGRDKINKSCFIFNVKFLPIFFKVEFKEKQPKKTVKISPPFIDNKTLSTVQPLKYVEKNDEELSLGEAIDKYVKSRISKIPTDFSSFEKFVTFSSVYSRIQNFKRKIVSYYNISQSLSLVDSENELFAKEYASLKNKAIEILKGFDAYERYLFDKEYYVYNVNNKTFYSSSFISDYEFSALNYDKNNFNSLINNLPSYLSADSRNGDFIVFVNMAGHFFDVLYQSISGLISERLSVENNIDVQKLLLEFFGFKVENLNLVDNDFYLTGNDKLNISSLYEIRRRLLDNLIALYKSKGTRKSFEILLNCFGIPENFLSVEEYGVNSYGNSPTYEISNEKLCLLQFNGLENYVYVDFYLKPKIRTIQFSLLLGHDSSLYPTGSFVPIIQYVNGYGLAWDENNFYHTNFPSSIPLYQSRGYYKEADYPGWKFGFKKLNDRGGVFSLQLPGYTDTSSCTYANRITYVSGSEYTSDFVPFFDGNLYSIIIRKNLPEENFDSVINEGNYYKIPVKCDVIIKRNEDGREVFNSRFDCIFYEKENAVWDGKSIFNIFDQTGSLVELSSSALVVGSDDIDTNIDYSIGNFLVWDTPIDDNTFEKYCNDPLDFSSNYGENQKHLILRLQEKEPYNFLTYESSLNYYYPESGVTLTYGYAEGDLENKNSYYPAFLPTFYNAVKSGSWIGEKTGNLETIINSFEGCASANFTTSYFYGTGSGYFLNTPINITGSLNGKLSGSFNGISYGNITSSGVSFGGILRSDSKWTGSVKSVTAPPFSYFSGTFDGMGSGSFTGYTFGSMTSSVFGMYYGARTDSWVGILTGSLTGSAYIGTDGLTGNFKGYATASNITVNSIGSFFGSYDGVWFGSLTGSVYGLFNGMVLDSLIWTGSSVYDIYTNQPLDPNFVNFYTGSFCGKITGSYSDQNYYGYGYFSGAFHMPWTGSVESVYGLKPCIIYGIKYYRINDGKYVPLHPKTVSFTDYCTVQVSYLSSSYPYYFNVLNKDIKMSLSDYPPIPYANNKLFSFSRSIDTRLDDKNISSYYSDERFQLSSDTNLIGVYLDPQKERNLDIFRYFGSLYKGAISDPGDIYEENYKGLRQLWKEFFSLEKQKILFNEIYSLYESYLFLNVFDHIKDIIPLRNNLKYGFVYQPNILERRKYQYKKPVINAETTKDFSFGRYSKDSNKKFPNESVSILSGRFDIEKDLTSFDYTSLPSKNEVVVSGFIKKDINLQVNSNVLNYIYDIPDMFQLSEVFKKDMSCKIRGKYNNDIFLKRWKKYKIYYKKKVINNNVPFDEIDKKYDVGYIWLYDIIKISPDYYDDLFYTSDEYIPVTAANTVDVTNDVVLLYGANHYRHKKYTARSTPNEFVTDIRVNTKSNGLMNVVDSTFLIESDVYFEPVRGYPRNHLYHKRSYFSYDTKKAYRGKQNQIIKYKFTAGSQNINTTIDSSGLENSSLPVETFVVGKRKIFSGENIINL